MFADRGCSNVHRYGTGTLTCEFVDRIFQECLTYEGEVVRSKILVSSTQNCKLPQFQSIVVLFLGLQDVFGLCFGHGKPQGAAGTLQATAQHFISCGRVRQSFNFVYYVSQAVQYFFRLLDIHGKGYLTAFTLNYFFRVGHCC